LRGAHLTGAILVMTDLTGADLSQTILKRCDFRGADLSGANLTGALLEGARFGDRDEDADGRPLASRLSERTAARLPDKDQLLTTRFSTILINGQSYSPESLAQSPLP